MRLGQFGQLLEKMADGMNRLIGGGGVLCRERLPDRVVEPHHLGDGGREVDGGLPDGVVVIVPMVVIVVGMGMLIVTMAGLR
jgi:hypothetical protein